MSKPSDIDVEQTDRIAELAQIPLGDRDAAWYADFLAAVPTAAFRVPETETLVGPDGFPYLAFFVPPKDAQFQGFSLRTVLDLCLSKGLGIAIYPEEQGKPLFVFNYGQLWSYKSTGRFDARPVEPSVGIPPPVALGVAGGKALVGAPSEAYFPSSARGVVREYLKLNGVGTPRVAVAADAAGRQPQGLLLNLYREDFQSDEHFAAVLTRLTWYFPPHVAIRPLVQRGTSVDELLEPF